MNHFRRHLAKMGDDKPNENPEETTSEENTTEDDDTLDNNEDELTTEVPPEEITTEPTNEQTQEVDYKHFFEEVTKPISYNGFEYKYTNPVEIRNILKAGLDKNLNKKEETENVRLASVIKNSGLDVNVFPQLIDIAKGNKSAIIDLFTKLNIKKEDLFPEADDDFSEENNQQKPENNYTPSSSVASQKEIQFQQIVNNLRKEPLLFNKVSSIIDFFGSDFYSACIDNPLLLDNLIAHVRSGIADVALTSINQMIASGQQIPQNQLVVLYDKFYSEELARRNNFAQTYVPPAQANSNFNARQSNSSSTGFNNLEKRREQAINDAYSKDPEKRRKAVKMLASLKM